MVRTNLEFECQPAGVGGRDLKNYVGHLVAPSTPLTELVFSDTRAYKEKILPLCKVSDATAVAGFLELVGPYLQSLNLKLSPEHWRRVDSKRFHAGIFTIKPFALPDGTGVEVDLNFWLDKQSILVESQLEIDVNSERTEDAPRSGNPDNRVLYHALALQYPSFADGKRYPLVKVPNARSFAMPFASLSLLPQVIGDMVNWYELIGQENMYRLARMLDIIDGFYDSTLGSGRARLPGFYDGSTDANKQLAEELATKTLTALREDFQRELLKAMRKEPPLPSGLEYDLLARAEAR